MAYRKETIAEYIAKVKNEVKKANAGKEMELSISQGNKKIGRVLNVSLPPILTCHNCSKCKHLCYDIKANIQYPNVREARARNLAILKADRQKYFGQIRGKCRRRRKNKYFRWHVAGDIIAKWYLAEMVNIAREFPDFVFWTYTKMYELVNEYVAEHGGSREAAIPSNLIIMFSEWRGMPMNNPYGFPEFRVVFKDDTIKPVGYYCPGNCDICKKTGRGCIGGETTYCHEH